MDWLKIKTILGDQPKFRYQQIERALFKEVISDWQEASNLPKELREKLAVTAPLDLPAEFVGSISQGSVKALMTLADGLKIETVLMKLNDRYTVCVSSQVGCPLGCSFCATGSLGFKRNLTDQEIINQAILWARYLKSKSAAIDNLVFMGMGEPFLNYDNVMKAIKFLNSQASLNIGARKISISSVGVTEGIKKMAKEPWQLNLAISLHATRDDLRSELIPTNKKYSIKKIIQAVDDYIEETGRKVMFEYMLIKDVNDSDEDAKALANLMHAPLYMVNLIAYNPTGKFKAPTSDRILRFKQILIDGRVNVTLRRSLGQDISAACGQLLGK
ncbi:MAG: 23S rRNA (adenine(2503)-C(2))-methyltransferase RlmN [Candidatus Falkowbacteria bacterium]|nr:23S rRNA (adenine(2503)-C(2))-methyltransferase RlmN [Candidatus Falkowbacteria bacterium]